MIADVSRLLLSARDIVPFPATGAHGRAPRAISRSNSRRWLIIGRATSHDGLFSRFLYHFVMGGFADAKRWRFSNCTGSNFTRFRVVRPGHFKARPRAIQASCRLRASTPRDDSGDKATAFTLGFSSADRPMPWHDAESICTAHSMLISMACRVAAGTIISAREVGLAPPFRCHGALPQR